MFIIEYHNKFWGIRYWSYLQGSKNLFGETDVSRQIKTWQYKAKKLCGERVTTQSLGQAEKLFMKAKHIAYHSYRSKIPKNSRAEKQNLQQQLQQQKECTKCTCWI